MKKNSFGYLFIVITVIFFSTYEVVSKSIMGRVNPFQINFLRFFIGGSLLLLFLLIKRDVRIDPKSLAVVALAGILNVVFSMNLLQLSLSIPNAKAAIVAVIFSSNPIFVSVFAAIMDKERIPFFKAVGMIFGILGITTISIDGQALGDINILSPVLALMSAVLYGLYTVVGRMASSKIGSLKMNAYSFLIGSIALLPFLLIKDIPVFKFDYSALLQVVYLSVFVTGIAYLTYFMGLTRTGAGSGSVVFFLKPVLASVFAIIFLGEKINLNLVLGTALTLLGMAVMLYWDKIKQKFV
ncbi:MAG TPA: DMT family transporter [Acetivibrio sp.]|uniref:DMT family transporter n=1 Tax=Acetivibrio sp. TaxID=1872092 RepID=UPI002CB2ED72|nr:DMT family transporter [Acetivibrio sp.]HOM03761.1 DMT family transporter [Acetivibrio sp.]